jgi:hypothetical protein
LAISLGYLSGEEGCISLVRMISTCLRYAKRKGGCQRPVLPMCTLSSDYSISWPASSYWPNIGHLKSDGRILETIGLSDIGLRPQSTGLSDIGLTKNYRLPTSAGITFGCPWKACKYECVCPLGYSDFHNLMGFTSKKIPNNIL